MPLKTTLREWSAYRGHPLGPTERWGCAEGHTGPVDHPQPRPPGHLADHLMVADEVAATLADGQAVVALESTIISHGLPFPQNVETALACAATSEPPVPSRPLWPS